MGPSATTVSAPQSGISPDSSFSITGRVTDESPGTKNFAQQALYPNGVPAISDADQEVFMEYLYEQQPYPNSLTGVPVSLDVIDPNGNIVHLGDAVSDGNGYFSLSVDANTLGAGQGKYVVIATFDGSNSYGHSSAESAFTVSAPSNVTPTTGPQQSSLATTSDLLFYVAVSTFAVLVAIAIVGVLLLRKQK